MEITMPQLGESVTEGTINRWLVAPGDVVKRYQPIAEVITDKVNAEIPAPVDGRILTLDVPEGSTVPVGARIATMEVAGEDARAGARAGGRFGAGSIAGGRAPRVRRAVGGGSGGADRASRGRYSPAVLRLAQEHGVDLSQVRGTGLGGRITRKDVEAFIAARAVGAPAAPPAAAAAPAGWQLRPRRGWQLRPRRRRQAGWPWLRLRRRPSRRRRRRPLRQHPSSRRPATGSSPSTRCAGASPRRWSRPSTRPRMPGR